MSDQTASYAVELDERMSGPAAKAATALTDLRSTIDRDTKALTEMQKAMRNLQGGTSVNIQQYRQLKAAIDAKKSSIAQAQSAYLSLGGSFSRAAQPARAFKDRMTELTQAAQQMPGPLGRLVGLFDKFARLVGGRLIAAGLLAIAAGVVAVTVATTKAVVNLYSYATAQANARRAELLRLEGLGKLWTAVGSYYGLAATSGKQLQGIIDRVSASSAIGRDQIARYSEQLYKMGLRGKNLESALEGMAIKASVQGEEQANMFAQWAAGAALTGGSVDRLTAKVKAQIGGIAKAQMLDANVQAQKLRERFAAMFDAIKIDGLLKARASLYSLLDQSTASGRALASILGRIVQPMVDAMAAALPRVKAFFQDLIIWELGVEISYLRLRNAFLRAFNRGEWRKLADECTMPMIIAIGALGSAALYFGVPALIALVPAALSAAGSLAITAASAVAAAAPFLLAGAAIWGLVEIVTQLWDLFHEEIDFPKLWQQLKTDLGSIDWGQLGKDIILGLAGSIVPGPVLDSLKSVASATVDGFKKLFGIASPSRVFAELGATLPEGLSVGIDEGNAKVNQSVGGMVSVPTRSQVPSAAPAAAGGPSTRTSGGNVTIQELHVHLRDAADNARGIAEGLRRELVVVLQDIVIEMGAGAAG